MSNNAAVNNTMGSGEPTNWIERVTETFLKNKIKRDLKAATKVHPCIINNQRVLVHEYGLQEKDPTAYEQLRAYAKTNAFAVKEDQRTKENKPVNFERRLAKTLPLLFLASGIFMSGSAAAADIANPASGISVMSDIEVTGTYDRNDRAYTQQDGKRFITNPYGETESILAVAAQTKHRASSSASVPEALKCPLAMLVVLLTSTNIALPMAKPLVTTRVKALVHWATTLVMAKSY